MDEWTDELAWWTKTDEIACDALYESRTAFGVEAQDLIADSSVEPF